MQIKMSEEVFAWYKDELGLGKGDCIRFYIQFASYRMSSNGFTLGIRKDTPIDPGVQLEKEGITFFMEKADEWYLEGQDLCIDLNDHGEPEMYQSM